ncbi:non-homologous end-joining DNA ligase, partial [Microbacterium sp.]|uniref:non-homologous end-joining DNA ligase n=1 Tax=Microbacterium sp. TaxID=51671 RepID=UPI003A8ACAED
MAEAQLVEVDGHRLRVSNLDKVLYPGDGTTKAEVIDYYTRVAPALLPALRGRPVTRKRWPEGTDEVPFFAKTLEPGAPEWMRRFPIDHSSGAKLYPVVEDLAALVYLAQVASLELHVPQWRFGPHGGRDNPDRLVLDLDPGPGVGLPECAQVAAWIGEILTDLGMDPVPVTSGSKGIHVYAPLDGTRSSEQISAFAKELARLLEADHPDLVVSHMSKSARRGKVFLDWSQNTGAKTTISPYSLRGGARASVAAPRTWAELADPDLRQLYREEVAARVERGDDPLAAIAPRAPEPLRAYLDKRDPTRTPEPMPSDPAATPIGAQGQRFVVQEHHARNLHYDLRLERDGVLVSWAVPRGIPTVGDHNRLAVMTEPHPREYLTFSGAIPDGEYGAGTMTIWDTGTYETEKWRDDEVIVTLAGRPGGPLGTARVALIRTDGVGEKSSWLLHRMTAPNSSARRSVPATAPIHTPMLAEPSTPALARRAAARWGEDPWVEFKWDGIRALGRWDGHRLRLRARSGTDITARYPELTAADLGLPDTTLDLDGEIVALDGRGRPSFTRLQNRMHLTKSREIEREAARTPVSFLLFDLLRLGDADLTQHPLRERRRLLEQATADVAAPVVVPPVADDVEVALAAAREQELEGVVVKDPRAPYRGGARSGRWLKVKLTHTQDVVIGGIRPGRGERSGTIGSLLVGVADDEGRLHYAGRVGSGFTEAALRRLDALLTGLRVDRSPFAEVPAA